MSDPSTTPKNDVEASLSRLLTIGVLTAAAVALVGAALYLPSHAHDTVQLSEFHAQPPELSQPAQIAKDAAAFKPLAVLQLGIMLLVLTPVARVAGSLVLFAVKRDRLYVVITTIVLAALVVGLIGRLG